MLPLFDMFDYFLLGTNAITVLLIMDKSIMNTRVKFFKIIFLIKIFLRVHT